MRKCRRNSAIPRGFKVLIAVLLALAITLVVFLLLCKVGVIPREPIPEEYYRYDADEANWDGREAKEPSIHYKRDESHFVVNEDTGFGYVDNIVVIYFYPNTTDKEIESVIASIEGRAVGGAYEDGYYQVEIKPCSYEELMTMCEMIKNNSCVIGASPDIIVNLQNNIVSNDSGTVYELTEEHIKYDEQLGIHYVDDIIVVYFEQVASKEQVAQIVNDLNGEIVGGFGAMNEYQIKVTTRTYSELKALCTELQASDLVSSAFPDLVHNVQPQS